MLAKVGLIDVVRKTEKTESQKSPEDLKFGVAGKKGLNILKR